MTNLETEPSPLPPPSPAPNEPTERRWARSDDRVVLGVAGGLARALAIDPLFVRIAFVVLALFSGVGILLYVAGLLLLADSTTSHTPSILRRVVGSIAVLIAARWLVGGDAHLPEAGWVVAIGLLGVAVALWRGRSPVASFEPPPTDTQAAAADGGSAVDRWTSWTAQRRERPRPPRSVLGLLAIGAAAVIGAMVWLFNDGAGNRGTLAFGWATVVLGAGLLVGTFAGRARWLILPALATAAASVIAAGLSFSGVGLTNRSGGGSYDFEPGSTIAAEYKTGIGDIELWLPNYTDDVSTSVEIGAGDLRIVVPDNAQVQIDSRVGIGRIDALGSSRSGYRRILNLDTKQGEQMIKLKLRVGVGSITVERQISGRPPFAPDFPFVPATVTTPDVPVSQTFGDGTFVFSDGSIQFGDGSRIEPNGTYDATIVAQNPDGSVQLENGAIIRSDGTVVTPGGFVIRPVGAGQPVATTTTSELQPPSPVTVTAVATTTTEVQP